MNLNLIVNNLKMDNSVFFTRDDVFRAGKAVIQDFQDNQLRYYLGKLLNNNLIARIGRNKYKLVNDDKIAKDYIPALSEEAVSITKIMNENFPLVNYCIWDFSIMNEFINHLIAHNHIFLEVEKESADFVFEVLNTKFKCLLKPTEKELQLYSVENDIILLNLVSGSPINKKYNCSISLEKLIVDMFANKVLKKMVSKGDYGSALEEMFFKYTINQDKLFRYAARRNKNQEIYNFIKENTNIKLLQEWLIDK